MNELEAARRDAVARLCRAQADGLISVGTFEDRYALVRDATSVATLDAMIADLADVPADSPTGAVTAATHGFAPVEAAESMRIPAILGSATRAGAWTAPEHIAALVIMGELTLDFRDANFTRDTVEIDLSVTLGSLKLIVPPGTQVENDCREVFSSSAHPTRGRRSEPNGILVVLRGRVVCGEVSVKERSPTGAARPFFKPLVSRLLGRAEDQ